MILTLSIVGLLIVLIAVITISYHVNKEGFEPVPAVPVPAVPVPVPVPGPSTSDKGSSLVPLSGTGPAPYASNAIATGAPMAGAPPQRTDLTPQVSVSPTGYDAMALQQKSSMINDILKMIRNQLIAERSMDSSIKDSSDSCADTNSTSQGKQYSSDSKKDMSQYIKKDGIPCWGCSLDY